MKADNEQKVKIEIRSRFQYGRLWDRYHVNPFTTDPVKALHFAILV